MVGLAAGKPPWHTSGMAAGNGEKMVVPRFTIRTLLAVTALCAVAFLLLGLAFRGQSLAWAGGLLVAVISVAVTLVMHAVWYGVAALFARLTPPEKAPSLTGAADAPPSAASSADEEAAP